MTMSTTTKMIAVLDEREMALALEAARALETAFDWDEKPLKAPWCWCKLQDLLFKIAGTTSKRSGSAWSPSTAPWRPEEAPNINT
jgi:hypothetical protein